MKTLFADDRIRFLFAGGSAALLNWLVRFPLSSIFAYPLAVSIALAIGMTYGFFIYRMWVFSPTVKRPLLADIAIFCAVNAAGFITTIVVAVTGSALLTGPLQQAAAEAVAHAAGIGVGAVVNYYGHRKLTFR